MACWRRTCSSVRWERPDARLITPAWPALAIAVVSLAAGCGHRGNDNSGQANTPGKPAAVSGKTTDAGSAVQPSVAAAAASAGATTMPTGQQALCVPANEGSLVARLRGAIDADIRWASPTPQCRGGSRPGGDGVRLTYKGQVPGQGPLLVVIGMGPLRPGESRASVPAHLTLVREGTGRFFATQGDDQCGVEDVKQVPVSGSDNTYRITGRGYCTAPARALNGDGSVLVSRFDVSALVEWK